MLKIIRYVLESSMVCINYFLKCIISLIYFDGGVCCICKREVYDHMELCTQCYNKIKFCNFFYSINKNENIICYSCAYYSGIVKQLILLLKYKRNFKAARVLSYIMKDTIYKENIKFDIITFVPSRKKVIKKRGYNQSELLAKEISGLTNKESFDILYKVKDTKDQIGLVKKERWENMKGSFAFKGNKQSIQDKVILLIDDVLTTGATSYCCAEQLILNGAKKVVIFTCAKGNFSL